MVGLQDACWSQTYDKDEFGARENFSGIKITNLGAIIATKSLSHIYNYNQPTRPAIATLAELAGGMAAVCQ